jgi:hypothetical protein
MEGDDGDTQTRLSEHSPPALASLPQNGDDIVQDLAIPLGEGHGASDYSEAHESADQNPAKTEAPHTYPQSAAPHAVSTPHLPSDNIQQRTPDVKSHDFSVSPSSSE